MNQKQKKSLLISIVAVVVIAAGFFVVRNLFPQKQSESTQTVSQTANAVQASGDMVIQKSSVTSTPSFYETRVILRMTESVKADVRLERAGI